MEIRFSYNNAEMYWLDVWKTQHIGSPESQLRPTTYDLRPQKPFVMVIPPPNITGNLHLGHALNNILQDFFLRFHLMTGEGALWVPGTDHGGIATQYVVERGLKTQGIDRTKISRSEFESLLKDWAEKTKTNILDQLVKMGCLLDFGRARFTMDEVCSKAVSHAFSEFFKAGLIYKGKRLINWCTRCRSALSDLEVEWQEAKTKLWHLKYPLIGGGEIIVATTRPETMLGDSAVAVNPKDERYKNLIGRKVLLPLMKREIPVIADERVEASFGTGAVKVTPGHDPLDFSLGETHSLPIYLVIGEDGLMTAEAKSYQGLTAAKAREKVLEDLKAQGLIVKEEPYRHNVGICYRCLQVIEPLVSNQWFLKMESLRDLAVEAFEKRGEPKFYPEHWGEIYHRWLLGLKDWCLSRQIVWGHRIPVWYCQKSRETRNGKRETGKEDSSGSSRFSVRDSRSNACMPLVSQAKPAKCPDCEGAEFVQDPDVLDTWFSSALWPMSVFGWPERTHDFERFYPTSLMTTGYEITYLWVARMVMMGLYFTGKVPFEKVYLHGIIRDSQGRKMSKSLGNVIDPATIQKEYSTDALRFALLQSAQPGKDMPVANDSFVGAKNFITKIWNAARFIKMEIEKTAYHPPTSCLSIQQSVAGSASKRWGGQPSAPVKPNPSHPSDFWILDELHFAVDSARLEIQNFNSAAALKKIYDAFWGSFCDWYIEITKLRTQRSQDHESLVICLYALEQFLKALQPAIPFVTHEIYKELEPYLGGNDILALESWPRFENPLTPAPLPKGEGMGEGETRRELSVVSTRTWWASFSELVTQIRILRSDFGYQPQEIADIKILAADSSAMKSILDKDTYLVEGLAKCRLTSEVASTSVKRPLVDGTGEIVLYLGKTFDKEKEIKKLGLELKEASAAATRLDVLLQNKNFLAKAPGEVVEQEKTKLNSLKQRQEKIADYLRQLG